MILLALGGYWYYGKQQLGNLKEQKKELSEQKVTKQQEINGLEGKRKNLQNRRNALNGKYAIQQAGRVIFLAMQNNNS